MMTHQKNEKSLFHLILENYDTYNCSHKILDFFTPWEGGVRIRISK